MTPRPSVTRQIAVSLSVAAFAMAVGAGCQVSKPRPAAEVRTDHPANIDPCSLLDSDEVAASLGAHVTARLLMPVGGAGGASAECWFEANGGLSEEVLLVPWSEPAPLPDGPPAGAEAVPGIGEAAHWSTSGGYRSLNVWRKGGLGFEVAVTSPTTDDTTARGLAVDLARKVAARLDAPQPGRPNELPAPEAAPVDVCQLLPMPEQVKVLGWADSVSTTPWEFVGGLGGGTWECRRSAENESLVIALTKTAVPEQELAMLGRPTPGLQRQAFFQELAPRPGGHDGAGGALLTTAPDGRMLKLVLFDGTSAARRSAALVALARVVLANLS